MPPLDDPLTTPDDAIAAGEAAYRRGAFTDARQAFESIVKDFSTSPIAVPARNYLEYLKRQG